MPKTRTAVAAAVLGTAVVLTPTASAADGGHEPEPITSRTLAKGLAKETFSITSAEPRDFHFRKIVVQPGHTAGWHYHHGEQAAVIKSGELTLYQADCSKEVFTAGDANVEPAGADTAHLGINLGDKPLVIHLVDLVPEGKPLAVPADDPGCEIPGRR